MSTNNPDSKNASKPHKPSKKQMLSNRFTDPIPSLPGKEPTPKEAEMIKNIIAFFDKEGAVAGSS